MSLLLAASTAAADPTGPHFTLAPFIGYSMFDDDYRIAGSTVADKVYAGGRLGYQFQRWGAVELATGWTPTALQDPAGATVNAVHASADFKYTPFPQRFGGVFLVAGGGARRLAVEGGSNHSSGGVDLGAGVDVWMNDLLGLRIEGRDMLWSNRDNHLDFGSHTFVFGAGLTVALGAKPRDTDGDGAPDRRDKCPSTPGGAIVDAAGCPTDTDGDTVLDGLDHCSGTPRGATVDDKGCPSDADGDKVPDGIDQCVGTPAGAAVDATGCPTDSDGDGVNDGLDRCPATAAGLKVDKDGCPIQISQRETELLDTGSIVMRDVNFATGKADVLPESYAALDQVGAILVKWPGLRIEIGGHTDSRGSDQLNQNLSHARVESVLGYMLARFPELERGQFTLAGYGESRPLVPNQGVLNMAKNRRVEFRVLNREALKRETERPVIVREGDRP
jgi:OOP family OmpA-OmpF porin